MAAGVIGAWLFGTEGAGLMPILITGLIPVLAGLSGELVLTLLRMTATANNVKPFYTVTCIAHTSMKQVRRLCL